MADPFEHFTAEAIAAAAECPLDDVRANWPRLVEQLARCGINERLVQIGVIGTVAKETGSTFAPVREAYYLGEPEPAEAYRRTLDYYPFYGRGFDQRTHVGSYRAAGPKIAELWGADPQHPDFDLVRNPDRLLDPDMSAADTAIYFRDTRALPTPSWPEGYTLLDACRLEDWEWVRRFVYGGPDLTVQRALHASRPLWVARRGVLAYNPDQPPERQIQNWVCAIRAATWALRSLGVQINAGQMQDQMVPGTVTPRDGLLDARGYGLAAAIGVHLPASARIEVVERATWADLEARAGRGPICLGSHDPRLYHWINVARQRPDGDFDAPNPSPNWPLGVALGDVLSRAEFDRYAGTWSLVFVEVLPVVDQPAAPLDLGTLVGVAYHEDGVIIPALVNARRGSDWSQVDAVVKFLRENNPHRAA